MEAELRRAEALLEIGRLEEALAAAKRAAAKNPDELAARLVIVRAQIQTGRVLAAADEARRAVALDPSNADAVRHLAAAIGAHGVNRQAIKFAKEAVALDPEQSRSHSLLSEFLVIKGDSRGAISAAEGAIRLAPYDVVAHRAMATAYLRAGRYTAAEQALRRALQLEPHDSDALSLLGNTLAARGDDEDAVELLQLAARADVQNIRVQRDMVRYVRRAAWGLATFPVIGFLLVFAAVYTQEPNPVYAAIITGSLSTLAVALLVARWRRLRRFPPAIRRRLTAVSLGSSWGAGGTPDTQTGLWGMLIRIPVLFRAIVVWGIAGIVLAGADAGEAGSSDRGTAIILAMLAAYLTYSWVNQMRKAQGPSPHYPRP